MRAVGLILKGVGVALAVAVALALALWQWSGSDSSLATVLQRVQGYLPAGQTLEAKDVTGSVRAGGHIGMLRWTRDDLSVQADDVDIAWSIEPLLQRQLQLGQLHARLLTIDDKSPASDAKALTPPTDLHLPFTVDVPFAFQTVHLTGSTKFDAKDVSGHYIFDSSLHRLEKGQGTISYGTYQFNGSLQAQAPMALKLQVDGAIQTTLPSSSQPLTVQAHAKLEGELAKPDASLNLQASLTPDLPAQKGASTKPARAMQAEVSAQIHPWQAQPLAQGSAQWQALNLAAVWPGAPQTELVGQANVTPSGANWRAQVNASNSLPGPWDLGRLPVTAIKANVQFAQGRWLIESLAASGAGGSVTGQGNFRDGQWQGQVSLSSVNPAALHSRLSAGTVGGKLAATQSSAGISFNAQLKGTQSPSKSPKAPKLAEQALDLGQLNLDAQGVWSAPQLKLTAFSLEALDAHVQGTLDYHTVSQATRADLKATLPGLQGTLSGNLSSTDGLGSVALELTNASQASHWLQRWPLPAALREALPTSGTAKLHADWQGGWQAQGQQLKVTAGLQVPALTLAGAPPNNKVPEPPPTQLKDASIDVTGTLAALQLKSAGTANKGQQRIQWRAGISGGHANAGHWTGAVNEFKLDLQPDTSANTTGTGTWTIVADTANGNPISLDWLQSSAGEKFSLGNGSARLQSPLPNVPQAATLSWQTANWSSPATSKPGANPLARWQSKGKLTALPLAWVDLLGFKSLTELGIQSNMLMNGGWDASQTESLKVLASLERSSGDLTIRTSEDRQQTQSAGVSLAQIQLQLGGDEVSASLRWNSTHAGQATVQLGTRLINQQGSRMWPDNAPVTGSIQVQMPPIEAWSVIAPPGWRLRGTLDAAANLSGTRAEPQWRGTLLAKDLAVRSVADGIDFQQGSLKAHLDGQQLFIDAFTLRGAGKDGGQITLSGTAEWRATDKADATPLDHVDMHLKANVQALRLSTRSDRRITVSGNLSADLKDTRLQLRGQLSADRATITLPSENAPTLGDDVVVRPTRAQTASSSNSAPANVKHPGARITPEVQIVFDLGRDFQVRGRGLDTRLTGQLELLASQGNPPTLTGTVNTVRGSYQAYGQRLDIEQGVVRFVGPIDNPVLDILAIRPKLTQRVGVQVIGTVLFPVVRLYAEPDLPEAEKLAWLVMGRSANGSGGEAALLQQAAMALLGGSGQGPSYSLTRALGLDELSFSGASGNADTTSGATITLGKRLSNDFYVAYESGLAGTLGVVSIFYDLSRSLTLRAKSGDQSAVDVIWTRRYD
jgi:translocation and assembly module TamB